MKNSIKGLEKLLRDGLTVNFLEIIDESANHVGHAGVRDRTELLTHVWVRVQATEVAGLSRIDQHRMLYATLQPAIDNGLHAIRFEIL